MRQSIVWRGSTPPGAQSRAAVRVRSKLRSPAASASAATAAKAAEWRLDSPDRAMRPVREQKRLSKDSQPELASSAVLALCLQQRTSRNEVLYKRTTQMRSSNAGASERARAWVVTEVPKERALHVSRDLEQGRHRGRGKARVAQRAATVARHLDRLALWVCAEKRRSVRRREKDLASQRGWNAAPEVAERAVAVVGCDHQQPMAELKPGGERLQARAVAELRSGVSRIALPGCANQRAIHIRDDPERTNAGTPHRRTQYAAA